MSLVKDIFDAWNPPTRRTREVQALPWTANSLHSGIFCRKQVGESFLPPLSRISGERSGVRADLESKKVKKNIKMTERTLSISSLFPVYFY
jgi:hypothetical protein